MRTSTIEAAGSRIRIIEDGSGEPAVLFVHGVGGWAENWSEAVSAVAATGRRAVAFDLPGFGESSAVPGARYFDLEQPFYAMVVEGVRRALGLDRPHLVGHSLGGGIAFVTAVTHPHAYRSLTLVAPGGLGAEIALFLRALSFPLLALTAPLPRPKRFGRAVLRSCFHDPSLIPAHLYVEGERYDRTYPETLRVMRHVATLRGVRPVLRHEWIARAPAYGGPVLVIWGRDDVIVPAAHADAVRGLFPAVDIRFIEAAGHLVMSERPDAFAAALLPFLDGPAARTMGDGVRDQER